MRIPVFVSGPTTLNTRQNEGRKLVIDQLKTYGLEARALGRSDYPTEFPLREVLVIAKHCSGGVILGFEQFTLKTGINKPGTVDERKIVGPRPMPTPWNHLEAGILFGLGLPLLIFREQGISGGVFDPGVTDVFVHEMPAKADPKDRRAELREVFLKWQARVRDHYYSS
jgi:hypothetical protein